jgi:thioesterase domain-containing protein/malonyl CoA-acyl carrier protein transacylase/acyl carrier protein
MNDFTGRINNVNVCATPQQHASQRVSNTETRLARLWADLLELEEIGINDDYFALGGNALLAVNLMARIEALFGVKLPLSSIMEAPTVAQLACLLESRGSHNPLVLIRKGSEKPPLFLVHNTDGETIIYRNLVLHLDSEQTVYGLKPFSKANHPILHTRIEEMADFHIGTMRSVQARGPYLIGGLCASGLIAFEMARQLQRAGERVAMVALMDVPDLDAKGRPLRWAKQRLTRLSSTLEEGKSCSAPRRAVGLIGSLLRKARNLTVHLTQSRFQMIRDQARMILFRHYLKLGLRLPAFLQHISVRTVYGIARRGFRPTSAFEGELILILETSGSGSDEPFRDRSIDPLLGWSPRATRGVRVFDVPGGHSSILQEPNVQVLAEFLQAYMDGVMKAPKLVVAQLVKPTAKSPPAPDAPQESSEIESAAPDKDLIASGVVEEAQEVRLSRPSRQLQLLVLSATSREAVEIGAKRLAEHLEELGNSELPDVSYTLAVWRQKFEWRRAVVAGSRAEAIERLRKGTGKGVWSNSESARSRPPAFVLAGVGEHAGGAAQGLYEGEPAFRAAADRCAEILQPLLGLDIRESMFTASPEAGNWLRGDGGVLKETRVAQPAAFVLDWALAQMWLSWGVKPAAVLGYSVGEYAAAALAGVLRLEDALVMVARRAQWIEELAEPGVMLAVSLAEAEIQPRLGEGMWVAAVNSPQATVVVGREESIRRLEEELHKEDVATRRVASDQGSHTPFLNPVRPHLKRLAEGILREPPQIPMLSNVTGSWLSASEAQDANHWCEHMCRSLRFQEGIGNLLQNQEQVLLEVGPGAGLGSMVRQHPLFGRERMGRVLSSLPGAWERVPDRENVAAVLGRLWVEGVEVDWEGYYSRENRRRIVLPAAPIAASPCPGWAATTGDRTQRSSQPDRSMMNSVGSRVAGVSFLSRRHPGWGNRKVRGDRWPDRSL